MSQESGPLPNSFRRVFVADDGQLATLVEQFSDCDVVAVDIEMGQRVLRHPGGVQEWVHILALIQLAAGGLSMVVDPLRCSLLPLAPVMHGPARKVFLGGGQDAAMLARARIEPRHIVDAGEIAYALFGRREDGMAALAGRIFGLSVDKTVRRTDWMMRPLNPTLLAYAHRDAELTLMIYRWFEREYPEVVALYQRTNFEPDLAADSPEWLRKAVARSSVDVRALVLEAGLEPDRDADQLAAAVLAPLSAPPSPRLLNRLVRIAADLRLASLLPQIVPLTESPSSLIRGSAARAIGQLATLEEGEAILQRLLEDPIQDVKTASEAAMRELRAPRRGEANEVATEEDETPLGGDAMAALQQLKALMEGSAG